MGGFLRGCDGTVICWAGVRWQQSCELASSPYDAMQFNAAALLFYDTVGWDSDCES
jgi:hypothetical protein